MEKIKQFLESDTGKDLLTVIIVVLVGLGSFELGRLSKSSSSSGIQVEYPNKALEVQEANVISSKSSQSSSKSFFASSRGKKYYSAGCSAGKSIKQENRIYFGTREEAERAGYELSSSCR